MNHSTKRAMLASLGMLILLLCLGTAVLASGQGYGPGRVGLTILAGRDHVVVGTGGIWNSRDRMNIQLEPAEGWRIQKYYLDIGGGEEYSPPLTATGNPKIGHFDYKEVFEFPYDNVNDTGDHVFRRTFTLDLEEDMAFHWGAPWAEIRSQGVAIFLKLVMLDEDGHVLKETGAWAVPELIVWQDPVDRSITDIEEIGEVVAEVITGEIVNQRAMRISKTTKGKVKRGEQQVAKKNWEVEEAEAVIEFEGGRWGWWFHYMLSHPRTGHFVDSPVEGLFVETPTYSGHTHDGAKFDYFPGETIDIALGSVMLGSTVADQKISPLDVFPQADTEDPRVINLARLLQSLDAEGDAKGGIDITPEVLAVYEASLDYWGMSDIDFSDDLEVENLISKAVELAGQQDPPIPLISVSAEDAKEHLDKTLNNSMFRKRISRTPELASSKAKMNIASVWLPALRANGDPATFVSDAGVVQEGIPYYDEEGELIRVADKAKPIVVIFTDAHEETGAHDVWAAISRDDGNTWKRKNVSRSGDRSSFETKDGVEVFGTCKKPVFQVKGNKVMIAWSSKYSRGGKPRYSIKTDDDYTYDDAYWVDDIWGVSGPQRSHDYTEDGYPEVGEVPYSAVWTCRGVICTQADVDAGLGEYAGDIVWFKPERLTSARRDANQIFCGGASKAGFGIVWQEDPKGLRPGKAVGPGPGWGGATTNHKTDIWYSYVAWGDHSKVDVNFVPGGDPEHDLDVATRRKVLVPMTLPVRLSDNDVLNMKNMGIDETTYADDVSYQPDHLTRCVKFEGGKTITTPDDPDAYLADYAVLRATPEDHAMSMNCVNCHVPFGTEPHGESPTQGAPIPLVVVDAEAQEYLGGFTNGDCVSCHYSHIVPRDRVIASASGLDDEAKCAECEARGGTWKDGSDGGEVVEAYYPYEGFPYIVDDGSLNDGTHRYGLEVEGLLSGEYYTFINHSDKETSVAITTEGRLLDGDTGASRANIFLQPYTFTKPDGTEGTSAWAIITYEETKGAGMGPPENTGEQESHRDDYVPEEGKNVIYHSFDFKNPDLVAAGDIINMPECEYLESVDQYGNEVIESVRDAEGNITPRYIVTEEGELILDWLGRPQLAYENARRGRFILQGWGAVRGSRTAMLMVYKEGEEGHGRPSDIMMQRWEIPEDEITFKYDANGKIKGVTSVTGNPYRFENIQGNWVQDEASEQWYRASGPVNMSSITPTVTTPSTGDPEHEDAYGAIKVVEWVQTEDNFNDMGGTIPFDDSRAHRGQIRGDYVTLGFSHTDNWAAARNGHDKYDFYIRRSFDGGLTWTTKPAGQGGTGVEHCRTWTYPSGTQSAGTKIEECTFYAAGEFEAMRNLSQMKNNFESVIEPRIVAVPGTIKSGGVWTGIPEDKQDPNVFYVAWGTSDNPIKDPITKEQDEPTPQDLYYSFSRDRGETYYIEEWLVNPDSDGNNAGQTVFRTPWMAKGDQEQGEVQLRMTPDGSRFYASWLDEGEDGSDIVFRRIMSGAFPANNATAAEQLVVEEDETSQDDFADSGGGE